MVEYQLEKIKCRQSRNKIIFFGSIGLMILGSCGMVSGRNSFEDSLTNYPTQSEIADAGAHILKINDEVLSKLQTSDTIILKFSPEERLQSIKDYGVNKIAPERRDLIWRYGKSFMGSMPGVAAAFGLFFTFISGFGYLFARDDIKKLASTN